MSQHTSTPASTTTEKKPRKPRGPADSFTVMKRIVNDFASLGNTDRAWVLQKFDEITAPPAVPAAAETAAE